MRQHATFIDPADAVGRRVVVRHRLHDDDYGATDVIGTLLRADSRVVTVKAQSGEQIDIDRADVIALKAVPPRTIMRRQVRDLEAAAALGWQGLDTARLGGWLLRAGGGFTGRANSCLPLDGPGMPIHDAIATVEEWYEARSLKPMFQVPEPIGTTIEGALDARGWQAVRLRSALMMTAPIEKVRVEGHHPALPAASIDPKPGDAWLANYHYRGGDLPDTAIDVMINAETVGFAEVYDGGEFVAGARGAVTSAPSGRRWLGVTAVEVVPHARRRGLGRHIVAELAGWGRRHAATDVYLQVAGENSAAIATYERLGFVEHHGYHYRRRDS